MIQIKKFLRPVSLGIATIPLWGISHAVAMAETEDPISYESVFSNSSIDGGDGGEAYPASASDEESSHSDESLGAGGDVAEETSPRTMDKAELIDDAAAPPAAVKSPKKTKSAAKKRPSSTKVASEAPASLGEDASLPQTLPKKVVSQAAENEAQAGLLKVPYAPPKDENTNALVSTSAVEEPDQPAVSASEVTSVPSGSLPTLPAAELSQGTSPDGHASAPLTSFVTLGGLIALASGLMAFFKIRSKKVDYSLDDDHGSDTGGNSWHTSGTDDPIAKTEKSRPSAVISRPMQDQSPAPASAATLLSGFSAFEPLSSGATSLQSRH